MATETPKALAEWHAALDARDPTLLNALVAEDCTFWSPVIHKPQEGRAMTVFYLTGAFHVLTAEKFSYVREVVGPKDAVLEFEALVDGITINGVDMIRWNDADQIVDFKVMVRPMKAVTTLKDKMAALLARMQPAG